MDDLGAWLYVVFLLSVLCVGVLGIRRTWLAREEPAPTSA